MAENYYRNSYSNAAHLKTYTHGVCILLGLFISLFLDLETSTPLLASLVSLLLHCFHEGY